MPLTTLYDVTCRECGAETIVASTYWPATRHEPADGELSPEECPKCGEPYSQDDLQHEVEPPEREPYDD
jgi:rRNA maturation protein Nop10